MTRDELKKIMDANPPVVAEVHAENYFTWSWQGCGFGELSFHFNETTKRFDINDECMGKESVRKLLHAFADYVVDNSDLK
jgi:hypothetical protein